MRSKIYNWLYVRAQIINVLFKYINFKNKESCPSVGPVGSHGDMLINPAWSEQIQSARTGQTGTHSSFPA